MRKTAVDSSLAFATKETRDPNKVKLIEQSNTPRHIYVVFPVIYPRKPPSQLPKTFKWIPPYNSAINIQNY
ncbi:hypothetical protein SESBI_41706 [Sesbania bispinosa]|nr:hypothetical protein SESBI_41706 [Sesbania bispinosa]